jgi:hypothetical protein
VLGDERGVAGRGDAEVDVRRAALVADGPVALEAVLAACVDRDCCPMGIVLSPVGPDQPELNLGVGKRTAVARRDHAGQPVARPDLVADGRAGLVEGAEGVGGGGLAGGSSTSGLAGVVSGPASHGDDQRNEGRDWRGGTGHQRERRDLVPR